MRTIAFAGCWHASIGTGLAVVRACAAQGIDTLVHTGDFMYTAESARKFLNALEPECARLGVRIIVVRGNHDNPALYRNYVIDTDERRAAGEDFGDDFARLRPHILHAPDGLRWQWEGVRFGALGGARSIDWRARRPGESWWFDEITEPSAIESMIDGGDLDVLVMHDVPAAVPLHFADRATMPSWWDLEGAEAHRIPLQKAVDATLPAYVISGHMHAKQVQKVSHAGHSFTSVILDRGDYKAGTPSREDIASNIMTMTLDQGQISITA